MKNLANRKEKCNSTVVITRGVLLVMFFIAISSACFAQDIIVTKDSKKIEAKVTEVGTEIIKYKLFDHQDGPNYTVPTNTIASIIYQNGTVETFTSKNASTQAAPVTTQTSAPVKTTAPANVQHIQQEGVTTASTPRFGIKGGLNSARESADSGDTDYRTGIHLGFLVEIPISRRLDIQPELVYSMQGGKSGSTTDKLDYINLPVMLKIYVNQSRSFSIDVGPQVGYLVNSNLNTYYVTENKIDVAVCLGVSYKFSEQFFASLRGNVSVTTIVDNYSHKNNVGQLCIGYLF
jgi:hypothetical protein